MITMHPPANKRCQIYSNATSVRCINNGTHWIPWGACRCLDNTHGEGADSCVADFYSWECDEHLFGEAA